VQIEFFPAGTMILQQAGEPARFLYVVRTGAVELLDEGRVLDLLSEGEAFGHPSLLSHLGPTFDVRAHEDTLCYLVEREIAEEVVATPSGLAFLSASLMRRERRAVLAREAEPVRVGLVRVRTLLRRPPVTCTPEATVREAAELMAGERISSVLVPMGAEFGIVTDRDLRSRVLAAGKAPDVCVKEVMSFPVVTASDDATAEEVLLLMLEHGFHHVPLTDGEGKIVGVVSDTDLLGLERTAPFALRRSIERATTDRGVVAEAARLPDVVAALVEAEADPVDVGHVIAATIDAATRQLIDLVVQEAGDPPGPWAWLALGSAARHEQSLRTDQDHAVVYDPIDTSPERADGYFAALAERVTQGLEAAGVPRCNGGVMATNPPWRRPVAEWTDEFRARLKDPGLGGKVFTNIALDYRRVAGPLDVESTLDDLIRRASHDPAFPRRLAHTAIEFRPPTGFFRDFVVEAKGSHAGTLDVKHGGITPITNLARAYAVSAGVTRIRTLWRLRDVVATGALDAELGAGLEEAFRLLWRVRLEHQAAQVRAGLPPDDAVDPRSLGPLTRRGLKEAFRLIQRAQRALASEMGFRIR
ncbi:MAG TPA: putative nucleotidyltransferase substrate binding domain-containing protein, partial [Actinomycetota bacterium]|nr:putative nucleotidyltransferase substrate binding domain-containing protein [Actinomycetota bacterium]